MLRIDRRQRVHQAGGIVVFQGRERNLELIQILERAVVEIACQESANPLAGLIHAIGRKRHALARSDRRTV
jgi:hypothetical protein